MSFLDKGGLRYLLIDLQARFNQIANAIAGKQNTIPAGTSGHLLSYTGTAGNIGSVNPSTLQTQGPEGLNIWTTTSQINTTANGTQTGINKVAVTNRTIKIGDLVVSSHANSLGYYGRVTAVASQTSVTVTTIGSIRGAAGAAGMSTMSLSHFMDQTSANQLVSPPSQSSPAPSDSDGTVPPKSNVIMAPQVGNAASPWNTSSSTCPIYHSGELAIVQGYLSLRSFNPGTLGIGTGPNTTNYFVPASLRPATDVYLRGSVLNMSWQWPVEDLDIIWWIKPTGELLCCIAPRIYGDIPYNLQQTDRFIINGSWKIG